MGVRIRVTNRMLFTWLMLAGLILLFAPVGLTSGFQIAFARVFRFPLSIGRNFTLSSETYHSLDDVVSRVEYEQLQNHLANLTEELVEKHKKIEELAGIRDRLYALEGAQLMPADIITAIFDSKCELVINRGVSDGLSEGQYVLGDNSIIGTICQVTPRTAKVRLISDPASKIEVKIAGVGRLMEGANRNLAKIKMLNVKHKVQVGEEVYARKKPGYLDAEMLTGRVAQCERDAENPLVWDIIVEPACEVDRLKSVHIIIMN